MRIDADPCGRGRWRAASASSRAGRPVPQLIALCARSSAQLGAPGNGQRSTAVCNRVSSPGQFLASASRSRLSSAACWSPERIAAAYPISGKATPFRSPGCRRMPPWFRRRPAASRKRRAPYLLSLPALLVFAALLVTPLAMIAGLELPGLRPEHRQIGGLTLGNYADTLGDPYYHTIFLRTVGIALATTAIWYPDRRTGSLFRRACARLGARSSDRHLEPAVDLSGGPHAGRGPAVRPQRRDQPGPGSARPRLGPGYRCSIRSRASGYRAGPCRGSVHGDLGLGRAPAPRPKVIRAASSLERASSRSSAASCCRRSSPASSRAR